MNDTASPQARANAMTKGKCRVCGRRLTNPKWVELGVGPICAGKTGASTGALAAMNKKGCRANFTILMSRQQPDKKVWINDIGHDKGYPSVTNDADAVVETLLREYPGHRIIYRDSDGRWDELAHDGHKFTAFVAYQGEIP